MKGHARSKISRSQHKPASRQVVFRKNNFRKKCKDEIEATRIIESNNRSNDKPIIRLIIEPIIGSIINALIIGPISGRIRCKGCIKTQMKSYSKAKKDKIKSVKSKECEIRKLQSKLLENEQKLIRKKMKDLKRGRLDDYSVDKNENEQLKEHIKKMIAGSNLESRMAINLYL